jgi:tetratricopeptide (TPR) repeat protein
MSTNSSGPSLLPEPTPDQRKVAAGQFERAKQVISTGNHDYGINLLLKCCKLDPGNLIFRQFLRGTERAKYRNNLRGHWLAWLLTIKAAAKVKKAKMSSNHVKVLEFAEGVLFRNPWDIPAQMAMAEAADSLGLLDMAIWNLEQARQTGQKHLQLNRTLARLYEKRGNFKEAMALWEVVRKLKPDDGEAQRKAKDLAASETIARGQYNEAANQDADGKGKSPIKGPVHKPQGGTDTQRALAGTAEERLKASSDKIRAKLKEDPTNLRDYLELAQLYRKNEKSEEAHKVLTEGLAATGNAFELAVELLDMDIEAVRQNLAMAEQNLKAKPDDPELRKVRAKLRKEVNARELDLYRQKAERFPNDQANRLEMGIRLLRAGQTDEAIRELQGARSDPKLRWQAQLNLGLCFKARNNWSLAQRNLEEALQILPPAEKGTRKEILFMLAKGAADTGDLPRAIERGNELANDDYSYRDIGKLVDEWQRKLAG